MIHTVTLFRLGTYDPDNPFDDTFDPDDPFAEPEQQEAEEGAEVIKRVRISRSSGDRAVDARGEQGARGAILFYFFGKSSGPSDFKEGDKIAEGEVKELPAKLGTVKRVNPIDDGHRMHYLEVSLV